MIAEVDLTVLRWDCTEAWNRNRKQELTGKEVAKKIVKQSGPALGKEAKQYWTLPWIIASQGLEKGMK